MSEFREAFANPYSDLMLIGSIKPKSAPIGLDGSGAYSSQKCLATRRGQCHSSLLLSVSLAPMRQKPWVDFQMVYVECWSKRQK